MRILITGSHGFIGKNLVTRLGEAGGYEVLTLTRHDGIQQLEILVPAVDCVIHLAGENRPEDPADFERVNVGLTEALCVAVGRAERRPPLILASSTQATLDNPYGRSKLAAERACEQLTDRTGNPIVIYRLPGVFGKWCKPNYNSVVATFCHNIARNIPVEIHNPDAELTLVHVDDVVNSMIDTANEVKPGLHRETVAPEYHVTLGDLAKQIQAFRDSRDTLTTAPVGTGFTRALYATYVSYLPPESFTYELPVHGDARGIFVEMLKTPDCGQFSFFTAHPGITRGGHYHHAKTEKFLVVKGAARFGFRHILTSERHEVEVDATKPEVVETIPGWAHNITNIGDDEMIVIIWANEVFDRDRPDTIASKV